MDLGLQGKVVLITGGSKGIGLACAEMLAREGCGLHLAARTAADLQAAKTNLENRFPIQVSIYPTDLSRGDEARRLALECPAIDILVNNAGAIPRGDLWQIDEDRWREAWNLKVFGYINLCRTVYPQMKSRGGGVIVNVIGAAGERPRPDYIAGGSANAALMAFTKALGAKSLKDGIRVVGVNPGLIQTQRLEALLRGFAQSKFADPSRWKELLPDDPKPGMPEDIASLVAFLSSDRARFITGTIVTADGGITGY
jgi:hypothetical protein